MDPNSDPIQVTISTEKKRGAFIEEESVSSPLLAEQSVLPSTVSAPINNILSESPEQSKSTSTPITSLSPPTEEPVIKKQKVKVSDVVPDLHGFTSQKGLSTELENHDATLTKQTIASAESKPIPVTNATPGAFIANVNSRIPGWYRTGWTALSSAENPGGPINILATQSKKRASDPIDEMLPSYAYGEWYHNSAALFLTAFVTFVLAKLNASITIIVIFCLFIATYYNTSLKRFRRNARDDIQREVSKFRLEAGEESVEWMNSFVHKFWLIFEPVLSALVVENLDNYISDYLPPYLDSIRLTTFTLGSKPFRIENVKTYPGTDPDTVRMDWRVSFIPNDTDDLSEKELDYKVNPKVIMNVRVGKRMVSAGFPVLVEDMMFKGRLRVEIKFFSGFPFVKLLKVSFLEKPEFDYVLKPLGTDSFGIDVNVIPGLSGFIRDQVHNILGPLMYQPNEFALDVDKFINGGFDLSSASGILAITVESVDSIKHVDDLIEGTPDTYVRFYLDHGQELDRTKVCERSLSPSWNETRYIKVSSLTSLLTLELKSSRPGLKDRRLGTANFDLLQLESRSHTSQEVLNLPILRNGKQVSNLRANIRYLPISKPIEHDDGTVEPPVESNSGILKLVIHECHDLVSNKENVNSFVRIVVNGKEKKKTSIVKRKNSPKFEESYEIVVLDKTNFFLRTEIENATDGEIIGACASSLTDLINLQKKNEGWFDLVLNDKKKGQLRLTAEWKPITMSTITDYVGAHGYEEPPIGVVRFTFWAARDLRNVEMVTNGKSDPYVRILSGRQVRGRTKVIENNLNPEWGEIVYVPVHSLKENFVLEIMDWNLKNKDKSLGFVDFKTTEIVQQKIGDQDSDPDVWYEPSHVKFNRWEKLKSDTGRGTKGDLHFSAEFFPALSVPSVQEKSGSKTLHAYDLHNSLIRYTPDDLIDYSSYNSGVLKVKIHEVQFSNVINAYCQVVVDSLSPLYETAANRGKELSFDETADAFIKELDFTRIAVEVKNAGSSSKDSDVLGHWIDSGSSIIKRIMAQKRNSLNSEDDQGFWFDLLGSDGPARIRLGFDYTPMANFVLNPDESLDNEGILKVELLSASNLKAADKSGTSDPYVVFTVNGEKVYKSETIRKTLNPEWSKERFQVDIPSRVTASIRVEVFDWNHVQGHQPIGSGGITVRGDAVVSFESRIVDIPLDGVEGVSGSVKAKFTWYPQLLGNKKMRTSVLGTNKTYFKDESKREASGPLNITKTKKIVTLTSTEAQSPISPSFPTERLSIDAPSAYSNNDSLSPISTNVSEANVISDATGKRGSVKITLLEARGLRGVDKSGTSDPFVRVKVGGSQVYKTKFIPKTLTPKWNEAFTIPVSEVPFMVDFKVKDHNKIKAAVDLGQSRVNLWDLIKVEIPGGDNFVQWLPLFPPGSGELRVDINFTPAL